MWPEIAEIVSVQLDQGKTKLLLHPLLMFSPAPHSIKFEFLNALICW